MLGLGHARYLLVRGVPFQLELEHGFQLQGANTSAAAPSRAASVEATADCSDFSVLNRERARAHLFARDETIFVNIRGIKVKPAQFVEWVSC